MLTAGGWGVDKFQKKNLQKSSSILHVCWNPNIIFKSTFTPPKKTQKMTGPLLQDSFDAMSSPQSPQFTAPFLGAGLKGLSVPWFCFWQSDMVGSSWQQLFFGVVRIQKEKFERWCFPDGSMWGILCFFGGGCFVDSNQNLDNTRKRSHVEKHGQYSKRWCFCPFSGGVLCELCQMFDW